MLSSSTLRHPASCAMRLEVAPRRMESPNVLRIFAFSSSPLTLELYIRMESMCRIPKGGGAMNPSCSPMMSVSSVPGWPSSPARVDSRRAVILKNGPDVDVSTASPRFFAAGRDLVPGDHARRPRRRSWTRARYIGCVSAGSRGTSGRDPRRTVAALRSPSSLRLKKCGTRWIYRQTKRGDCSGSIGHTDRHPSIETRSIVMSAFALGASSVLGASRARLQHRRPQAVAKPRASIIAASKKKVFIDGEAGTTGLQVRDRLAGRDDIEIISLTGDDRKDPAKRAEFLNAADAAILCLPDDAAIEAVAMCTDPDTVIIDASTAHRVADGWAYGFPELNAEQKAKVASSKRIANPGVLPHRHDRADPTARGTPGSCPVAPASWCTR